MDFTEFDRKFATVDRNFKQEYRVLARINHDGVLWGYRIILNWGMPDINKDFIDVDRVTFGNMASAGQIQNVKMTTNGPSGINGFALKAVKTISITSHFVFIAELDIQGFPVGYVISNIGNTSHNIHGHGKALKPGGIEVIGADELKVLSKELSCKGIEVIYNAYENTKSPIPLYRPILDGGLANRVHKIDIGVSAPDGKVYMREPYVGRVQLSRVIGGIPELSGVQTFIKVDTPKIITSDTRKMIEDYRDWILRQDIANRGTVGATLEEAMKANIITDEYLARFGIGEEEKSTEQPTKSVKQSNSSNNTAKNARKGIFGIFNSFKR